MSGNMASQHEYRPSQGHAAFGWSARITLLLLVVLTVGAAGPPSPAVQAAAATDYAALAGTYTAADQRTIGVYDVTNGTVGLFQSPLVTIDLDSGRVGALSPLASGAFAVGPALAITAPVQATVTFARDGSGQATSLIWTQPGAPPLVAQRQPLPVAEVRFPSGDITLAGRLTLPPSGGRHPAVVFVPGAGRASRFSFTGQWMSALLARHGIATLVADKRGVGDSGGQYAGNGAATPQLLATLVGDARAAVQYLRTRPEIDPTRIGLLGYSQGGWISPLAASQDPGVAFMILVGGPTVSVGTSDTYAQLATTGASADEIAAALHAPPSGFDPGPILSGLHIPGLWLYGGRDQAEPAQASQEVLAQLQQAGHPEFSTLLFPTGDHQLFDSASGAERDTGLAPGYAPGLLPALSAWLTANAAPPGPTFPETRQTIGGLFAPYWAAHDGQAALGVPLTGVLTETSALDGRVYAVQVFQQAVLEYHPAYVGSPFAVLLGQLGTYRYQAQYPHGAPNQQPNKTTGDSRFFSETGHWVGGRFWDYWQQHGGLAQLGYPLSDEFSEPGDADPTQTHTVQYFERAVLEAHPENPPPYDVLRLPLGALAHAAQASATPGWTQEDRYDVGGYRLWLRCVGAGRPTVVMDAGLGTPGRSWNGVVPAIAAVTRVCIYDRANLGQSDPGPDPRPAGRVVQELHALLAAAGIPAPYVLVGHSQGGLNMQLYARTYPAEVTGLVLVDAVHPAANARTNAALTPEQVAQRNALLVPNAEHLTLDDLQASDTEVQAAGPLPAVPLIVLRHGRPLSYPAGWPVATLEGIWSDLQTDLAGQSPLGRLVVAAQSGHFIQQDQPGLVSDAVRTVVAMTGAR